VVNADDFGFTSEVNTGILEAHHRGILTATTLMATGPRFDHAVQLARENPSLDVGVHLQIVQGPSLSQPGRDLPASLPALLLSLAARRWDILAEFRLQTEKLLAAGLQPSHLDTHKHTHLLPPVLVAVAAISREYNIPWVRRPFDLPFEARPVPYFARAAAWTMKLMRRRFSSVLSSHGCRSTDHFAGFVLTGSFTAADLCRVIENLPPGSTEFMCHPGHQGPELFAAPTRLKLSRSQELAALLDPRVRETLVRCDVELCSYRGLIVGR
jgi:predicted glycoside hydrolase/deacetylase ChbG (UPF0249 family)